MVWLQGGASHLETYDPKPDAPAEIRGPFGSIATRAAGVRISELLPRHAEVADRFSILRSLSHTGFCHQQGNQQMFTGHPEQVLKLKPEHPDLMCIAHRRAVGPGPAGPGLRGRQPDPVPRPGLPRPGLRAVRGLRRPERARLPRRRDRPAGRRRRSPGWGAGWASRRGSTGSAARSTTGCSREAFDAFQRAGVSRCSRARRPGGRSTSNSEDPRLRDRYGRNTWGQRCLLARRLVEAGVDLVTTSLDGPALRPGRQLGRPRRQPPRLRRHEGALPVLRPGRQRL